MTSSRTSNRPAPSDAEGRYIFAIDPPGAMAGNDKYGVSCWRDGMWRGMVVADTLQEAALAAVQWHMTGELDG